MNRRSLLKRAAGLSAAVIAPIGLMRQNSVPVMAGIEGSIVLDVRLMNSWLASIKTTCHDGHVASRVVNYRGYDSLADAVRNVIDLESVRVGHRFKNIKVRRLRDHCLQFA